MRELLVGVLVDVSGSMASAIENRSGESSTRLEAFRDALEQLARKGAGAIDAAEESGGAVELRLFAYGFGFGNILSSLLGRQGSPVRDLLSMPGQGETLVSARQLSADWPRYKANVERLIPEMFGNTPMGAAFDQALDRFARHQLSHEGQKLLLIVSDGDPTDRPPEAILAQADALKAQGILVISCYVTGADIAEPRRSGHPALASCTPVPLRSPRVLRSSRTCVSFDGQWMQTPGSSPRSISRHCSTSSSTSC